MTYQTKAQRLAEMMDGSDAKVVYNNSSEAAAELHRLDANEAQLVGSLMAAANYIDTLGGVSQGYRQLITRIEAERNAK